MRAMYYRRDGTPYLDDAKGWSEWAKDLGDIKKRRVAFDILPNGVEVSTVWLGLDHRLFGNGRPLIFETMLFVPQKHEFKMPNGRIWKFDRDAMGDQWRYSTEEEALRGHKMQVKKWGKFKSADQVLAEK